MSIIIERGILARRLSLRTLDTCVGLHDYIHHNTQAELLSFCSGGTLPLGLLG